MTIGLFSRCRRAVAQLGSLAYGWTMAQLDPANISHTDRRYLAAVLTLGEEGRAASQACVARRLGRSAPTVSATVHRLLKAGLLRTDGRHLALTRPGWQLASASVKRLRLAEVFLADVVGLPWHMLRAQAVLLETAISAEVEERVDQVLGRPSVCPHGNAIPGAAPDASFVQPLSELGVGQRAQLKRVTGLDDADEGTMVYLTGHGFVPGTDAVVAARGPDGAVVLEVCEGVVVIGRDLAEQLLVTPLGTVA